MRKPTYRELRKEQADDARSIIIQEEINALGKLYMADGMEFQDAMEKAYEYVHYMEQLRRPVEVAIAADVERLSHG